VSVLGLFCMFNVSATCRSVHSLQISAIAFFTAFVYCVTVDKDTSSSVICRYVLNTSKVDTRLSGPAVSLKALNIICRAVSLSIPDSSMTII
jgi:hypothetical protein